ncbi:hypothetical protein V9T40_010614 [Parthenolecanium corni]|uniref:Uncharacterized protein n=1 Tax=Parthenolecanium corni TaxID=536013 RepID=A0AAN9T7R2_9HEMI
MMLGGGGAMHSHYADCAASSHRAVTNRLSRLRRAVGRWLSRVRNEISVRPQCPRSLRLCRHDTLRADCDDDDDDDVRLGLHVAHRPTPVGHPIELPKVENPSDELVDRYHDQFILELRALFDRYKSVYDDENGGAAATLVIE